MSDIRQKTIMQLFDEYWTTMMRCWTAQEKIMDKSLPESERLKWAIRAQEQNAKRTELIRVLDELFGYGDTTNTTKTYHTYFEKTNNG